MAGMTKIEYKGLWRASLLYSVGDAVFYNSGGANSAFYVSLAEDNLNHIPSTSPTYWKGMTSVVDSLLVNAHDAYVNTTAYVTGDIVTVGSDVYVALTNSTNKNPATNSTNWQLVFSGSSSVSWLLATYKGVDIPGTGANTLPEGKSRIWYHITTLRTMLVTNINGFYKQVELSS